MRTYSEIILSFIESVLIFLCSSPGKLHSLTENNNSKEEIYQKELLSFIVREGVTIALVGLDLRDYLLYALYSKFQVKFVHYHACPPTNMHSFFFFGIGRMSLKPVSLYLKESLILCCVFF